MFFKLARNNASRSRKENGLYFISLVISIMAFYTILSLENQDVMVFLKTMESDAVARVLAMIPVLYGISLFFLFFLVYCAGKYQVDRRNHELGMYLMMGMARGKLYKMLLLEEIWSSALSLLVGIPAAVFVSEMISLITAKVVGLGIVSHQFTFSITAVLWTVCGYAVIRLLALAMLCGGIMRKEIGQLLAEKQPDKKSVLRKPGALIGFFLGLVLLVTAFVLAIRGMAWNSLLNMAGTVAMGIGGILLLFYGMGILFEAGIKAKGSKKGLGIFNCRQLQELLVSKFSTLAVSCLLIFMALCCFGYGVSVSLGAPDTTKHVMDYTFSGEEKQIKEDLTTCGAANYIDQLFQVKVHGIAPDEQGFAAEDLADKVAGLRDSEAKDRLEGFYSDFSPQLISLSGYNEILKLNGKKELKLGSNRVALFNGPASPCDGADQVWDQVLSQKPYVELDNQKYYLSQKVYSDNIVTDRAISIAYGLILPDAVFEQMTKGEFTAYWNASLKEEFIQKDGLMQAIAQVNSLLDTTSLEYESYLQNIGRKLFYTVGASYTTIYLAVIFLIIANTAMGVQFLMQQQKTGGRFRTLIRLGSTYKALCQSARKQIGWYFGIPITVAAICSILGVKGLFTGLPLFNMQGEGVPFLFMAAAIILILCVIELIYVVSVMKLSDKRILALMESKREDH